MMGRTSFSGTDLQAFAQPLSYFHHHHVGEQALHVRAYFRHFVDMIMIDAYAIDLKAARRALPPLLRGYARPVHWLALPQ